MVTAPGLSAKKFFFATLFSSGTKYPIFTTMTFSYKKVSVIPTPHTLYFMNINIKLFKLLDVMKGSPPFSDYDLHSIHLHHSVFIRHRLCMPIHSNKFYDPSLHLQRDAMNWIHFPAQL